MRAVCFSFVVLCCLLPANSADAQRNAKGPWSEFLASHVERLEQATDAELANVKAEDWEETRKRWQADLRVMLGIAADLDRTPLKTKVTGSLDVDGVHIDRLHYQSRPGLYVTANLYVPTTEKPEGGWPAVLYVCGHANVTSYGRLMGNKTGYQHHGLWLARHGFVCLMIDTIQKGEMHGEHHGTYKLGRWDWVSRGFTPAGVEAWNAIRGVDLLAARDDVDAAKIGVTGRSGGGAYSWFAAALDDRIQVAIPVAGITDLRNHVIDGCVEGHCDCMYFCNYFGWDYDKLAALIAPRALLLENSDTDSIFPLDGVVRIDQQVRDLYHRLGAGDRYGLVITPGPHKDTQDLRVPAFRWLQKFLQGKEEAVTPAVLKEIPTEQLAVFEREVPKDEKTTAIAASFVDIASDSGEPPVADAYEQWRSTWLPTLERMRVVAEEPEQLELSLQSEGDTTDLSWQLLRDESTGIAVMKIEALHGSLEKAGADGRATNPVVHLQLQTDPKANGGVGFLNEALGARIRGMPPGTHYVVQWRGAEWLAAANSVRKRQQIVRRFYLLGLTPEQVALNDLVSAVLAIAQDEPQLDLAGAGRESLVVALATLLLEGKADIGSLRLASVPNSLRQTACIPGIAQVCSTNDLLVAAKSVADVEDFLTEPPSPLLVDTSSEPQQANGLRVVEVGTDQATIWVRATRWPLPNLADMPALEFEKPALKSKRNVGAILPEGGVAALRHGVPGVPAEARVGYRPAAGGAWKYTNWESVDPFADFSTLVTLSGLEPGTSYSLRTEVRAPTAKSSSHALQGRLTTLPDESSPTTYRLAVGTCQAFVDRDGPHGFDMYRTMLRRDTDAFVMAGDVVYYDRLARSVDLANYHWQRTYGLPTLVEFHKQVPVFFLKDDHDTYVNDTWPGVRHDWTGDFTFEDGQRIFQQQTGLPDPAYRTFSLGRDVQVWLMEGRDYRSANDAEDGPGKTIWGDAQKDWLRKTLSSSSAKHRLVISPTPLVGPDRNNKRDNHSNRVFATEGQEVRELLASFPNTMAICGDRHWQYHSIDPATGLHEFSVGPASDRHAGGWKQSDFRPDVHQFLRVGGGYLEIDVVAQDGTTSLTLSHLDTAGELKNRVRLP